MIAQLLQQRQEKDITQLNKVSIVLVPLSPQKHGLYIMLEMTETTLVQYEHMLEYMYEYAQFKCACFPCKFIPNLSSPPSHLSTPP